MKKLSFWSKLCSDLSKVENYEQAIKNPKIWTLHHRLETHNSDNEKRLVFLHSEELVALDMYYNRPPEELIFMRTQEHRALHNLDKERLRKMKETMNSTNYKNSGMWKKGQKAWNKGTIVSDSEKEKIKRSLAENPNSRQNKVKRMRKAFLENNRGMSWNQFQHNFKEEF